MSAVDFDVVTGPPAPPARQNGEERAPVSPAAPHSEKKPAEPPSPRSDR